MIQNFDFFDQHELPYIVLCNPDKTEIFSLDMVYGAKITQNYNALSEFNFTIPESIQDVPVEAYPYVKNKRLVLVENIGYFIIDDAGEDMSGMVNVKNVKCVSLEAELISKRITSFKGNFKFYDILEPERSLIDIILTFIPNWNIGTIDSDLWLKQRSIDVKDNNIYNFLMTDVATAYSCIFTFNTFTRTISATTIANATTATDIYLSFDNLVENATLDEKSDEITTRLFVYGAGDLDISTVNPLGTASIYDFTYYKTIDWMSQSLIDAITLWEDAIGVQQPLYATKLAELKVMNEALIVLEGELVDLQGDYLSAEQVLAVRIEAGLGDAEIQEATDAMNAAQEAVDAKQAEVDTLTAEKELLFEELQAIHDIVDIDNNFTVDQLKELSSFVYENTYQNKNFIQNSIMDAVEIQDMAQDLYDQGKEVLAKISMPRYEFSIRTTNFLFLKEFLPFTNQLQLGCTVTAGVSENYTITTVLLKMSYSFDDPTDMELTFSNRMRLDNGNFIFSDLFGNPVKTGTDTDFSGVNWNSWVDNYESQVSIFIDSALNATNNAIINSSNQQLVINGNGLRGKHWNTDTNSYDPTQMWLTSSTLAFTDDNWQHSKLALGQITVESGNTVFGLIADVLVGKLLVAEDLTIENGTKSFIFNQDGAFLTNATLTLTDVNNLMQLSLDPTNGIRIQTKIDQIWTDTFYLDGGGNLKFAGALEGASGSFSGSIDAQSGFIGGWAIEQDGLLDVNSGNYIRPNDIVLGKLEIHGSEAYFYGNFYSDNMVGKIKHWQVESIDAGTITVGYLSGDRIYGGTICWPGACLGITGTGVSLLNASSSFVVRAGGAAYEFTGSGAAFLVPLTINGRFTGSALSISGSSGSSTILGGLSVGGRLQANGGVDSNVVVTSPSGTKSLHFIAGTFTGWNYI